MISARDDIARDASDEDLADRLIEHELDGHARIRAREDAGEGLLVVDGTLAQDEEVTLE